MIEAGESIAWAENDRGHPWEWKKDKKPEITQYQINPLDVDIQGSLDNLEMEEGIHGVWEYGDASNVMLKVKTNQEKLNDDMEELDENYDYDRSFEQM